MAERNEATNPGTRWAAAKVSEQAVGLRLFGIVDDPPRPSLSGSAASPTSCCIRREMSRAILPRDAVSTPQAQISVARLSLRACQGTDVFNPSCLPSVLATAIPGRPRDAKVPLAPPT